MMMMIMIMIMIILLMIVVGMMMKIITFAFKIIYCLHVPVRTIKPIFKFNVPLVSCFEDKPLMLPSTLPFAANYFKYNYF